jgi:hypothetical protein
LRRPRMGILGITGTNLATALFFSSGALSFGQTVPLAGSICGHVVKTVTHQPIASAKVVMALYGSKPPFFTQVTGADGSFCFSSLSSGQYTILAFKAGFVLLPRTPGTELEYAEIKDGKPTPALELRMVPTLPVSSAAGAFDTIFSPEQRGSLDFQFDSATFSPDGRYLAVALWLPVKGSDYGDAEQILRYDLMTHKLFAITPGPATNPLPKFNEAVWRGDTLYTAGTLISRSGVGQDVVFKTDGDTTIAPDSFPPELKPVEDLPLHLQVGSYSVDGTLDTGTEMTLSSGGTVIGDVQEGDWATLDAPPAVFYPYWDAINVFYLRTRYRQIAKVPNPIAGFLAVTPIPNGFRVAYWTWGDCGVNPRTLSPSFGILPEAAERGPANLCFADVPDESRANDSEHTSKSR